jgi:hypothetical protein
MKNACLFCTFIERYLSALVYWMVLKWHKRINQKK